MVVYVVLSQAHDAFNAEKPPARTTRKIRSQVGLAISKKLKMYLLVDNQLYMNSGPPWLILS
jgi:hypothetical protein